MQDGKSKKGVPEMELRVDPLSGMEKVRNTQGQQTLQNSVDKKATDDPKVLPGNSGGSSQQLLDEFEMGLDKLKSLFHADAHFEINREADMVVVKITNRENGELIRQIPPEVVVRLARNINELLGVLFDERA